MAAQDLGRIDPLVMIVDGLSATFGVGIAERPLIIDHDEDVLDARGGGPSIELCKILFVVSLVFEELIDVFAGADAVFTPGDFRKIEIRYLVPKQGPMQRPFRKRDPEQGLATAARRFRESRLSGEGGRRNGRCTEKIPPSYLVNHG